MSGDSKPSRLVYYDDEEGMLRMDEDAVSILQRVKGPIGVVSVCGPSQHGKSYISNQLLGSCSGFNVGRARGGRGTEGLWMWISPSRETAADGTEYSILVIDTEGFDDCRQTEQYFYLAFVLSSMLIYNQMRLIDGCSFGYLSVVTKMADMAVGETTGQFSPIFLWLLRDFHLDMRRTLPSEYMESCLNKPFDGPVFAAKDVDEKNKAQTSIKAVFPVRHCIILRPPSDEPQKLSLLDQTSEDCLEEEFKNGVNELRSFVLKKTKPKKIGATTVMTGPIFVQITNYILDAFNSGKRPTIASIEENVEKTMRRKESSSALSSPAANTRQRTRSLQQTPIQNAGWV